MTDNNRAVFEQRGTSLTALDDFPTPPWATRALMEYVLKPVGYDPCANVLEPACGRGHMARTLQEYFDTVTVSDLAEYGQTNMFIDYLNYVFKPHNWIITNPPFKAAHRFIEKALTEATHGVAMFVRTAFLEGQDRYLNLYQHKKPNIIAQFAERVVLHEGVCRDPDKMYQDAETGLWKKPSTATSYAWLVWYVKQPVKGSFSQFMWIPPQRVELTRINDYV
jgi:hypothetical protein